MTQDDVNRAEWEDPENWWGGRLGLYASRRDTRAWVPKRTPALGWTVNFGRPSGWLWLAALLVGPPLIVLALV
jgi:uncharacterized membrane protein